MNNAELLAQLDAAMKNITVSDLSDSVLSPGQLDRFIRQMQRRTNVLQEARMMVMTAQSEHIDRIGFAGRVITGSLDKDGVSRSTEADTDPAFSTNKLNAAEFRAKTGLTDRALRRNIERGGLEGTLVDLFGEAAGRDLEEIGLMGDTDYLTADPLKAIDGWMEKAEQKLESVNPSASDWPANLFEDALQALPKQFMLNPGEWRYYVPWGVANAYRDYLIERKYNLSDEVLTGGKIPAYKGIPVVPTAMLERSTVYYVPALLSHPDNMVWGVFHQVTIEADRDPSNRLTKFYLTVEADVHYEDENAAVAVFIENS